MMELRIISPTEDGFVQEIRWNHEELKTELAARMEQYNGLVITDDQIKEGKADLANLRKLRTAIEDERKRIKNKCLEPYQKFETQIKELVALIDQPIALIDSQIKEYDQQKKVAKMNEIQDIYDARIGTLRNILPFERVMGDNNKWLNVSTTMKNIEAEIVGLVDRVNRDLDTIEGLGSRYDSQIRDVYIKTLDLSQAMQEKARLEELERQLAERKAAQEEARYREEQRRAAEEAARASQEADGETAKAAEQIEEPVYAVSLEIRGTRAELTSLQGWLKGQGIGYSITAKAARIN